VLRQQRALGEKWADDYPSMEQIDYLQAFLVEASSGRPRDFWQSQLRRLTDGLVVGGAGVTGPPDATGTVVIGYELAGGLSDAQHGAAIVLALVQVAREMGAKRVTTNLFEDDVVRRQVYADAGLTEVSRDGRVVYLGRKV
jgi:RimJ/RimL family protein N-acetyltransferase